MLESPNLSSQPGLDPVAFEPVFDFRQHLNGALISEGIILGPTGRVVSKFVAHMEGNWDGLSGELHEDFRFASGKCDHRVWHIKLQEDGQYSARAHDIIGTGQGYMQGASACSRYRIQFGPQAHNIVVSAVDWMHLTPTGVILNQSKFRKFGVKVAELFATMRPA